ncbi:MAG: hypothetical protein WBL09_10025 [Tepidanaerobacteraceae bacterium]
MSLKALPVNALIGLEQTTRFTGGHDLCAPGMGDNLAVKVRCGLGSGNH